MTSSHSIGGAAMLAALLSIAAAPLDQVQAPAAPPSGDPSAASYVVFLASRPIGREEVAVARRAEGWVVRGTSRIDRPIDIVTRHAEIQYDAEWHARSMRIEGTVRGAETAIETTFADGQATSKITVDGKPTTKTDTVAADAVVLPNALLGSYAALAHRLVGARAGAAFTGYIAPQGQIDLRVESVAAERIETPQQPISATHVTLSASRPQPAGALRIGIWIDPSGALLRLSVPQQTLELAREDISSAASRTTAFSLAGDEAVRIPASGFTLAGTITKPKNTPGPLPAIVLIGGSGPIDRDGFVAGIPVLGQIARGLVDAGFLVVRYDKRGIGQSGGRTEAASLADFAEDVRSVVKWLRDRKDVDDDRIGLVGYSEGAWIAMRTATREDDVKAIALVAAAATTGAELVLEQQRHVLEQMKVPEDEAREKIALQLKIHHAALTGEGWDEVPPDMRAQAESPFFQSFLAFDPADVMEDVDQPVLIVQGALDTEVPPAHAEKLAVMARARDRRVDTDVVVVPGVNHLLVPAKTGEVNEYGSLTEESVSPAATAAIGTWMAKELGPGEQ